MLKLCVSEGVGVIPWSPLARGRLARGWDSQTGTERAATDQFGKNLYTAEDESNKKIVDSVGQVAEAHSIPRAQVALAWLLHQSAVTAPIVGATKPHHLEDAVKAVDIELTAEDIALLDSAYTPRAVAGFA